MNTNYISPHDLASLFRDNANIMVVDVRSYDYTSGKLPTSINIPSHQFEDIGVVENLTHLVSKAAPDLVVFHCHLSQERGPFCYRVFSNTFRALYPQNKTKICVLEGGFKNYRRLFCEDSKLYVPLAETVSNHDVSD
ncbi:hypothetical protein P9112_004292 [Eukaryota sp. TZLM1-RC]